MRIARLVDRTGMRRLRVGRARVPHVDPVSDINALDEANRARPAAAESPRPFAGEMGEL